MHTILEQDNGGYTPLHLSAFYGDFAGIQFLLKHCGNKQHALNIVDNKHKKKVLDYAENDQVRKYLIDLKDAAHKGDQDSMKLLVNCGHDLNQRSSVFGVAPLHRALNAPQEKRQEILKYIIGCEASLDIADSNGWTALVSKYILF